MTSIEQIVKDLGRPVLQKRLGLKPSSISDAISLGLFPARWYGPMTKIAKARGVKLPLEAFHWRPEAGQNG